jgi:hypothetical protein
VLLQRWGVPSSPKKKLETGGRGGLEARRKDNNSVSPNQSTATTWLRGYLQPEAIQRLGVLGVESGLPDDTDAWLSAGLIHIGVGVGKDGSAIPIGLH